MGQKLPQHGPRAGIEGHLETEVELILGVIGALAGEGEPLELGPGGIHLDLGEGLVLGAIHGDTSGGNYLPA